MIREENVRHRCLFLSNVGATTGPSVEPRRHALIDPQRQPQNRVLGSREHHVVLENVVGLLTHEQGSTLRTIVQLFEQVGYKVSWKVLNAALYGLPQRRERLALPH